MSQEDNLIQWKKDNLDTISGSFCAAKWKQVTIHLQNGHTHSCHHPMTHKVPIEELEENPGALHNTSFKKAMRRQMLEGVRPPECGYCWKVEDNSNSLSDRTFKSHDKWAAPYISEIVKKPWDDDVDPSYVEVSFGNVCNFKCSYCSPHISSKWMEEVQQYGGYPTTNVFNNLECIKSQNLMPIPNNQHNPYIDAFWKWWPTIYNSVEHFRITGGEPLLNKNTFKVLDYIIENPNPNLDFSINTNMCPPVELLDKFIEKIKIIIEEKKVKKLNIFTSAEAHGRQAEYIRFGMDYDLWLANIYKIIDNVPDVTFTVMSTYNILSLTSYTKFLNDILDIKRKYGNHKTSSPVFIDIPYLRHPYHQTIFIIEPEMLKMIYDQVTYMYHNLENKNWYGSANCGFFENESQKLRRVYQLAENNLKNNNNSEVTNNRKDFIKFVDEHDRRRGTNFLETFPEMDFAYNRWKNL